MGKTFLEKTLKALELEYDTLNIANNTVMTRKNLLDMILSIKNNMQKVEYEGGYLYLHKVPMYRTMDGSMPLFTPNEILEITVLIKEFLQENEKLITSLIGDIKIIDNKVSFVVKHKEMEDCDISVEMVLKIFKKFKEVYGDKIKTIIEY